jgi:hypothetical protein
VILFLLFGTSTPLLPKKNKTNGEQVYQEIGLLNPFTDLFDNWALDKCYRVLPSSTKKAHSLLAGR